MSIPVLLIGFNRPDLFISNLENILSNTSGLIFIALDGPRKDNSSDAIKCAELRNYVEGLALNPRIHYKINDENYGCKVGVETALDWFFSEVDFGLILEDDCIASEQAFQFAISGVKVLKERNDIFALNLTNFSEGLVTRSSNTLTKYIHVWGWVTTSKNWRDYRKSEFKLDKKALAEWSFDKVEYRTWLKNFTQVKEGKIDTWDFSVQCHLINNKLYCVAPLQSLVENKGFDDNATHTKSVPSYIPTINRIDLPKDEFKINENYDFNCDKIIYKFRLKRSGLVYRIARKLGFILKNAM